MRTTLDRNNSVIVSWTNPPGAARAVLVRKTRDYPRNIQDGNVVLDAAPAVESCVDSSPANGHFNYYRVFFQDADGAWNYDERLLGGMVAAWLGDLGRDRVHEIPRTFVEGEWRIDRSDWEGALAKAEERGSLAGFADAHLLRPGYTEENWPRVRRLLRMALCSEDIAWVDDYRERWVHVAG